MKYDGTGWCKQTAAIEEGRHRSGSFTHWCAQRPGTKSLLMKVLAEAQGVRGLRTGSIRRAHQTAAQCATPCHAEPGLLSQGLCSFLGVVCHRCLLSCAHQPHKQPCQDGSFYTAPPQVPPFSPGAMLLTPQVCLLAQVWARSSFWDLYLVLFLQKERITGLEPKQ